MFALSAPVAVLGLRRARAAGESLIVLSAAPLLVSSLGTGIALLPLAVITSPGLAAGILYLLSAAVGDRVAPPGRAEPGPQERPQAA